MKSAWKLERQDASAPTQGWFVATSSLEAWISAFRPSNFERVRLFALGDGFLVTPGQDDAPQCGDSLRLQSRWKRVFFPVNARLRPALHPEEVPGILGEWGVVFLPQRPPLLFDPNKGFGLDALLRLNITCHRTWNRFPEVPDLAQTLHRIEWVASSPNPDDTWSAGAPQGRQPLSPGAEGKTDIPEDARPPKSSPGATVKAHLALGSGRFLDWVGTMFGLHGLKNQGQKMIKQAIDQAPRLTESLLGAQEAALREVLRQLRSGEVEKGLRRAPPTMNPASGVSPPLSTQSKLSEREPNYFLGLLWGESGRSFEAWMGGGSVWEQLAAEYHKLAREALDRGDHRRAAYLYGYLLGDLHAAAGALSSGGLWRDAGLLYRDKLNQPEMAARHFVQCGDYDEAVRLYDHLGNFEVSGDLLMRMGAEEEALDRYDKALLDLVLKGRFLAAAELAQGKMNQPDRAFILFQKGWEGNGGDALPCGLKLLEHYGRTGDGNGFLRLLESEPTVKNLREPDAASRFWTLALDQARGRFSPVVQKEVSERARLFGAALSRAQSQISLARGQRAAQDFFAPGKHWSPSVQRDAVYATARHAKTLPGKHESSSFIPTLLGNLGISQKSALSLGSGDLVLASNESLRIWRADPRRIEEVEGFRVVGEILGVTCDFDAETLFLLTEESPASLSVSENPATASSTQSPREWVLRIYSIQGPKNQWSMVARHPLGKPTPSTEPPSGLTQVLTVGGPDSTTLRPWLMPHPFLGERGSQKILVGRPGVGMCFTSETWADPPSMHEVRLGGRWVRIADGERGIWQWDQDRLMFLSPGFKTPQIWNPRWSQSWPGMGDPVNGVGQERQWSCSFPGPGSLSLLWVDFQGRIHGQQFRQEEPDRPGIHWIVPEGKVYDDVCHIALDRFAALTVGGEVEWWKIKGGKCQPFSRSFQSPASLEIHRIHPRIQSGECLGVTRKGSLYRIPLPE